MSKRGWLIYNQEDYAKNKVYAKMLRAYGAEMGLEITLLIREEMTLGVDEAGLVVYLGKDKLGEVDFVINRSRDGQLSKHMEYMGVRVFNTSQVTEIANDKGKSHQFVNRLGIPSVPTLLFDKRYMRIEQMIFDYPLIIKSVDGHGGEEVYQAKDEIEARGYLEKIKGERVLIQKRCSQVGVDVRVFVIGDEIVGAIKRESQVDFRSNYSLGGSAKVYELSSKERGLVHTLLKQLSCDFVGIDFMIDARGAFVFNEIEDAVGSRTLYAYTDVDSAKLYIAHIKNTLQK